MAVARCPGGKCLIMGRMAIRGAGLVLFVLLYHLLTVRKVHFFLQFDNLPLLSQIFETAVVTLSQPEYWIGVLDSVERVFLGFFVACLTAIPLGILMARNRFVYDLLRPVLELFRPIPNVAWVPVSILLFPKIEWSIYFITYIGAFFPVLLNTIKGARNVAEKYVRNGHILGFSGLQTLLYVVFPASLPLILTGATIGMGTSWLGVIVAESTYGAQGIGYFTFKSLQLIDYPNIVLGMLSIGVLGLLSTLLLKALALMLIPWEAVERG